MATAPTTGRGAKLRARRERLNVSRARLAARAGCSVTHLSYLEQGVGSQPSAVLERAVKALDDIERKEQRGHRDH